MSLQQFANAPDVASPTTPVTTLSGAIDASVTTLTVASTPTDLASPQFQITIDSEILLVTAVSGTTWTVTRGTESTSAASHSNGASIFAPLTRAGLLRNPRSMTATGDVEYLNSSGAPTRLAAGTDSQFVRYSSGLPVAGAIVLGDVPAGVGLTASPLSQFASTTSAQLRGVLSDETGTGAAVFADTPTLIAPLLGTPTSGLLSNCTGLPLASITGLGTGVATFLGTPSSANLAAALTDETGSGAAVFATSPTLVTPILGIPQSGTLTNCTLPVGGLTGLGTGVATWLATPSSANLAAAITNETGTGVLVFNDTPTILTPTIASLVNATHTHQNAAGGGTLDAAAIAAGTLAAARGGTGVSNTGTITLGGNLTTSGAFATTFTMTAATGVTFPTTGTLATLAGSEALTNKTLNGNTFTTGTYTLTGVAGKTLTFNKSLTLEGTDSTTMTFPTTSATIARTDAAQTFTGSQTIAALVGPVTITEAVGTSGLTITGATQTTAIPALSLTQTWNAVGTAFKGVLVNITNTTSASTSRLLDLQVGATSKFGVRWDGITQFSSTLGTGSVDATYSAGAGREGSGNALLCFGEGVISNVRQQFNPNGIILPTAGYYAWGNVNLSTATPDTLLYRGGAAATIQLGVDVNGAAVNQTLWSCSGITGTDKTGSNFTIASGKGTGAGAVSSLIFQTPTVLASSTTAQSLATRLTIDSSGLTIADTMNVVLSTSTGTKIGTGTTQKLGFFNATPVAQQTRGATLTNNVTSGGTTDQIDDFAASLYATDAATIRNDIYQLARIVRLHDVALRALGLES